MLICNETYTSAVEVLKFLNHLESFGEMQGRAQLLSDRHRKIAPCGCLLEPLSNGNPLTAVGCVPNRPAAPEAGGGGQDLRVYFVDINLFCALSSVGHCLYLAADDLFSLGDDAACAVAQVINLASGKSLTLFGSLRYRVPGLIARSWRQQHRRSCADAHTNQKRS